MQAPQRQFLPGFVCCCSCSLKGKESPPNVAVANSNRHFLSHKFSGHGIWEGLGSKSFRRFQVDVTWSPHLKSWLALSCGRGHMLHILSGRTSPWGCVRIAVTWELTATPTRPRDHGRRCNVLRDPDSLTVASTEINHTCQSDSGTKEVPQELGHAVPCAWNRADTPRKPNHCFPTMNKFHQSDVSNTSLSSFFPLSKETVVS